MDISLLCSVQYIHCTLHRTHGPHDDRQRQFAKVSLRGGSEAWFALQERLQVAFKSSAISPAAAVAGTIMKLMQGQFRGGWSAWTQLAHGAFNQALHDGDPLKLAHHYSWLLRLGPAHCRST